MTAPDLTAAFTALDAFAADCLYADSTPGIAVALTDRHRTIRVASYGSADLAAGTPVTPETLFESGSIGKSFTADALLVLADRGMIDLDAPVTDYLPWFAVPSRFGPITPHHLLTHTAGIIAGPDSSPSAAAEVWQLRDTEASSPPGVRCHYSNVGYKALGLILAEVAGRSYPEVIQQLVLDPLDLVSTRPAITNDMRHRLAVGYTGLYDDRPFHPRQPLVPAPWLETDTGDGCLATTAADLAAYARMLLNRGDAPAGRLLSDAGFARKTTAHAELAPGVGYGYGIMRREMDGRTLLGHSGGMVGYVAYLLTDLDAGLGVAVLMNGPGAPRAFAGHALALLRAAMLSEPLPAADSVTAVANPQSFVGVYRRLEGPGVDEVEIDASVSNQDGRLILRTAEEQAALDPYDDDVFLVDRPVWSRFLLAFERDDAGRITGFSHGGSWLQRVDAPAASAPFLPPAWRSFVGHYRSHNPWCPGFRVVTRRGRLWLIFPAAPDGFDDEQPLAPLDRAGHFQAGDDPAGPERTVFDVLVGDQSLRATLSGCPYWRVETP